MLNFFFSVFSILGETFCGCIFVQLLGGIIFMSTSLFQLETALRNPNLYLLTVFNVVFVSSSNLYFYSFGGSVVTENALKYADALFDLDWYTMPNEFQKFFIIMIGETQRPIYLHGYGLIRLSLDGFMRVNDFGQFLKT